MALTYNGATAGTTLANPPILAHSFSWNGSVPNSPGLTGAKLWFFTSTNVVADLTAPGAIADGYSLGMRVGDILLGVSASAGSSSPIAFLGVVGLQASGSTAIPGLNTSGVSISSNFMTSTMVTSG